MAIESGNHEVDPGLGSVNETVRGASEVEENVPVEDAGAVTLKEYKYISFYRTDKIATLALNRPEKHNALTEEMSDEIADAFGSLSSMGDISVVILKGEGPSFCSGHDLNEPIVYPKFALSDQWFREVRRAEARMLEYRDLIWRLPQPVIAQIHGHVYTIGLELAMQCDIVVAARESRITLRSFGGAGFHAHLWPWRVGVPRAKELLFTGAMLNGEEAEGYGMVNHAVPLVELDEYVKNLAARIAKVPLSFLALEKMACNKCYDLMGVRDAIDYSTLIRAVGYLTKESQSLRGQIMSSEWKQGVEQRNELFED